MPYKRSALHLGYDFSPLKGAKKSKVVCWYPLLFINNIFCYVQIFSSKILVFLCLRPLNNCLISVKTDNNPQVIMLCWIINVRTLMLAAKVCKILFFFQTGVCRIHFFRKFRFGSVSWIMCCVHMLDPDPEKCVMSDIRHNVIFRIRNRILKIGSGTWKLCYVGSGSCNRESYHVI